jgi:prepilin-type processing-associated H-X9-DG protein
LACLNYESAQGELPAGTLHALGKGPDNSATGWQVSVLPYMEQSAVSSQMLNKIKIEEAAGRTFGAYALMKDLGDSVTMYTCPSDDDPYDRSSGVFGVQYRAANYAGVMGSYASRRNITGACQEVTTGKGQDECAGTTGIGANPATDYGSSDVGAVNFDGLLPQDYPIDLRAVEDGLSNTFLIGERWYMLRAWAVGSYHNGNPADPVRGTPTRPVGPLGASYISGCKNVHRAYPINASVSAVGYAHHHLPGISRPTDGTGTPKKMGYNDCHWGSSHPGGAHFAFGDGSVRFLPDALDMDVMLRLASRNDGEPVSIP